MCCRWLATLALVLIALTKHADAEAQQCSEDALQRCESECQAGRAVACHLQGQELERRSESFETHPDGAKKIVDESTLQKARTFYELGCTGEFTWSCYKLVGIDQKRSTHWRRLGLRVDRRLCNKEKQAWACSRLALVYKEGSVVQRNLSQVTALFERACQGGEAAACAHLGSILMDRKPAASKDRGVKLLEQGCIDGLAWSCIALGSAYRRGETITKDLDSAERLLRSACKLDHQEGCVLLSVMLDQEPRAGGSKEAFGLFNKACEADVPSGCVNLGDLYETGRGVRANLPRAAKLFEAACDRFVGGCVRIGRMYDEGRGVSEDAARARGYFGLGCQNQDDNACFHLALSLRDGRGGPAAPQEAAESLRSQCQDGRALSCQVLADMHSEGGQLATSPAMRRQYLRRACKLGREQACDLK